MAYKFVNYLSSGLWFECQHVKQHARLHLSLGTRSLPALLHQTRAATAVASGMATEATRMVLKHDVEGEWFQYTIEIYWDYWRVLKVWMEWQAFQLTDVPWYGPPSGIHPVRFAAWPPGLGLGTDSALGHTSAPRNVLQNPASHRRKTSKNIGKTMSIFWKLPHSTCFNGDGLDMPRQADPQIHHHPSSSIIIPSSPALFRSSIISISCSFLGHGPDSNGSVQGSQDFCCARSARCP